MKILFLLSALQGIEPPDSTPRRFGQFIAADGKTLIVGTGAERRGYVESASAPAVAIQWTSPLWNTPVEVRTGFGVVESYWGSVPSLSGDTLALGLANEAYGFTDRTDSPSSVVLFEKVLEGWREHQRIMEPRARANFGECVDLRGEWLAVGAPQEWAKDADWGAAYIYGYSSEAKRWELRQRVTAWRGSGHFGDSLALSDRFLAVGRPLVPMTMGRDQEAVFVFERRDGSWEKAARVEPLRQDHGFGKAVDIEGDWLAVGAPYSGDAGLVHVYERSDDAWVCRSVLEPTWRGRPRFGYRVLLHGDWLFVTAYEPVREMAGVAYAYRHQDGKWQPVGKPRLGDLKTEQGFGASLALAGNELLVGAPKANDGRGLVVRISLDSFR